MYRTTSALALGLVLGLAPASAQQDTQQQRSAGLLATAQQSLMVGSMVGASVHAAADDDIVGSIDDVVISLDGEVEGIIIGIGGWLGIAERDVLVPMTDLSLQAGEDELRLVMQRSREELEGEPEFRRADEQIYGVTGGTGAAQPDATAEYGVRQDQARQEPLQQELAEEDPMPSEADEQQIVFQDDDSILASTMIGTDVRIGGPEADEELGQISDVLVTMDGEVEGAVIGVGGWLGLGEKDVVVAMDQLDIRRTEDDVRVSVTESRESLEAAESFQQPQQQ